MHKIMELLGKNVNIELAVIYSKKTFPDGIETLITF